MFAAPEAVEDAEPVRVGERFEPGGERVEVVRGRGGHVAVNISMIVDESTDAAGSRAADGQRAGLTARTFAETTDRAASRSHS